MLLRGGAVAQGPRTLALGCQAPDHRMGSMSGASGAVRSPVVHRAAPCACACACACACDMWHVHVRVRVHVLPRPCNVWGRGPEEPKWANSAASVNRRRRLVEVEAENAALFVRLCLSPPTPSSRWQPLLASEARRQRWSEIQHINSGTAAWLEPSSWPVFRASLESLVVCEVCHLWFRRKL